jgi:hypothetical protein
MSDRIMVGRSLSRKRWKDATEFIRLQKHLQPDVIEDLFFFLP